MALNLGELYLTAKANFSDVHRETAKAEKEIKGMGETIKGFSSMAKLGFAAAASAMVAVGIKSVKLAADMEQSKIAFKTMLGGAAEAEKMLKSLYSFAAKTPFEFPEISAAAKSLLAFGEAADSIPETLRRIGDISSGIGAPLGEIASLYGKIRVQGRLFADDINQFTGRGIPIVQELADQFRVADEDVKKLVADGKIGFPQIEQAFKSLTSEGGKFYNMMAAQSDSMAGLWSTFKDSVNMAMAEVGANIIETFDLKNKLKGAIEFVSNITKWFTELPKPVKAATIAFVGVSTAIIGISAAVSALKTAMIALNLSFGPFLIGGAIAAGLIAIVSLFSEMGKEARLAAIDIKNASDSAELETAKKMWQSKLDALRAQREADLAIMSLPSTAFKDYGMQQKLVEAKARNTTAGQEEYRLKVLEYGTQIEAIEQRLEQLSGSKSTSATYQSPLGSGVNTPANTNTVLAAFQKYGETLKEIETKVRSGLPGYDALQAKIQALRQAIDTASGATDANTANGLAAIRTAVQGLIEMEAQLKTSTETLAEESKKRVAVGGAIVEAIRAEIKVRGGKGGGVPAEAAEAATPKIFKFGDYVEQVGEIMRSFKGPLTEFGETVLSLIDIVKTVQGSIGSLTKEGFAANSKGPLGEIGGMLSAFGAISGILGAIMQLFDMITGASKSQQEAAEEWRRFLAEASTSEMFKQQDLIQQQIDKFKKIRADIAKKNLPPGVKDAMLEGIDKIIKELEKKMGTDIPNRIKEMLGITVSDLSNQIQNAFDAANPDEYLKKFDQGFNEIMRRAMLQDWLSKQALAPMSDAMAAAFSDGTISQEELANLKSMWSSIGEQGKGFFGVLDQLGLSAQNAADGLNKTAAASQNLPAYFKYATNRFAAASPIPAYASGTNFHPGGMALIGERGPEILNLPRGSSVTPTNGIGGTSVKIDIHLENSQIYGINDLDKHITNTVNRSMMAYKTSFAGVRG